MTDKLDWFNGYYIRQKSDEELLGLLKPFVPKGAGEEKLKKVIPLIKDRIKKLSDFDSFAGFFFEEKSVDENLFGKDCKEHLEKAAQI